MSVRDVLGKWRWVSNTFVIERSPQDVLDSIGIYGSIDVGPAWSVRRTGRRRVECTIAGDRDRPLELIVLGLAAALSSERVADARLDLHNNRGTLEQNLGSFVAANLKYASRRVASIGLHADDMDRAEVFWEPEGYTLLRGLEFVRDPEVA